MQPKPIQPATPEDGPVTVTHRRVFAIAGPMTLAYLSTPLLGLVDMTVIGRLGDASLLGAIAVGALLFDIVFSTVNFLRSGTTGLTAQAVGAGNRVEVGATFFRALILAALIGLALIVLQTPALEAGLWFVGASPEVNEAIRIYFTIRVLSAPFAFVNYVVLGWFVGLGRAGTGLLLQTFLNSLNMALNAWMVLVLGWGVAGVAWGTVIAELATALVGIAAVFHVMRGRGFPSLAVIRDRARFLALLALNRDIMIRSFVLMIAFTFFTAQGAKQGDAILAANAVLMNFFLIGGYFLDGFATAAEQLVGEAIGARRRPVVEKAVRLTLFWGAILGSTAFVLFWIAGPVGIDIMTTNPEVRALSREYLIWAVITPLVGFVAFQFDGIYIGATWSAEMRNMMILSLIAYLIAWWLFTPIWGNHGLWLAINVFIGVRGITMAMRYPVRLERTFAGG